jgi:hypothetical protein
MKLRNWHKRNTQAANDIEARAHVSNGGPSCPHVQITFRSDERGRLLATMSPEEARHLIAELTHCVARYEPNMEGSHTEKKAAHSP